MDNPTNEQLKEKFGVGPNDVGNRPRGWWIVDKVEDEEREAGARVGDLCVKTRDGGSNPPDMTAGAYPNYRGTACDGFDWTYRYYYYAPLTEDNER